MASPRDSRIARGKGSSRSVPITHPRSSRAAARPSGRNGLPAVPNTGTTMTSNALSFTP